jgi:hypothetical protein
MRKEKRRMRRKIILEEKKRPASIFSLNFGFLLLHVLLHLDFQEKVGRATELIFTMESFTVGWDPHIFSLIEILLTKLSKDVVNDRNAQPHM